MQISDISRREIYRYLGYRGIEPSEEIARRVEECLVRMMEAVTPRYAAKRLAVSFPEEGLCDFGVFRVNSRGLFRNLSGCSQVYLMAATIGLGVDRLIARANVSDVTAAAIYQAAGAAAVEAWSDEVNEKLLQEAREEGLFGRPRFSPGYGDFSLEHQKDFSRVLEMPRIGITLSDSLLMTPSKSVTAVIGLSETDRRCPVSGCEGCEMRESCAFRRE